MLQKCYIFAVLFNDKLMKWSELKKKAIENGWYFVEHGKKHDIYEHAEKDFPLLIERHGSQEVKNGIYQKLKKQIGF